MKMTAKMDVTYQGWFKKMGQMEDKSVTLDMNHFAIYLGEHQCDSKVFHIMYDFKSEDMIRLHIRQFSSCNQGRFYMFKDGNFGANCARKAFFAVLSLITDYLNETTGQQVMASFTVRDDEDDESDSSSDSSSDHGNGKKRKIDWDRTSSSFQELRNLQMAISKRTEA